MNFLPSLSAWHFAFAGLVCAAGPFLIHLLNRRRYRVVHWAAMDFLREAIQRNRKFLQVRDILLLILRTVAILLFGAALAKPYYSRGEQKFDGTQPLHAVVVIDNSLSMGYQAESASGNLLDRAKERTREFLDKLPKGSRISIIPLCGSQYGYSPDPYDTKDAALESLARIEVVDRSASVQRAINEAKKACEASPELAKRVIVLGDQQRSNWADLTGAVAFKDLPSVQFVDVGPTEWENSWISDLRIQDGLADVETPATFIVDVHHRGSSPRPAVQVTLHVDGVEVASKTVALDPADGARQVTFEYVFSAHQPEPGRAVFVPVKATLTPDSLPLDDERHLIAPVVAALPVVFVDQYGADEEDSHKNRLGETRHLRKLLAPVTNRGETSLQLVRIRHLKIDELNKETLADARLVVIAGIESPGDHVTLLREYVQQGGQLVIAAGAKFDQVAWTAAAWRDGQGILPAPLKKEPLGTLPEEAGNQLNPFYISYESMSADEYFHLPDTSENDLRDLYSEPFFFKAVETDLSDEVLRELRNADVKRLQDELQSAAEIDAHRRALAEQEKSGKLGDTERAALREVEAQWRQLHPEWLLWRQPQLTTAEDDLPSDADERRHRLEAISQSLAPRSLARFTNEVGVPYLVERPIGAGKVLFVSSGLQSSWNTLPKTNTMFLFDRILRSMIQTTLPRRNFNAQERITLPLLSEDRQLDIQLSRPNGNLRTETLDIGFIGKEQRGVTVTNALSRGLYRVSAMGVDTSDLAARQNADQRPVALWEIPLGINGDSSESDLEKMSHEKFDELAAGANNIRWVGGNEEISLAGAQIHGQTSWWYFVLAVLICLLAELAILAWPSFKQTQPIT